MHELLANILDNLAGPEMKAVILEASELLDDVSYEDHQILVENAIMTTDNDDSGETFAKIHAVFENAVIEVLRQHSVFVSDDQHKLAELTVIARAIVDLEHTESEEFILDVCERDMFPSEKLAEIIQITTGVSSDEILLVIDRVDSSLIDAIRVMMRKKKSFELTPKVEVKDLDLKKRKLEKLYEGQPRNPVAELLSHGMSFGMFFDTYLDLVDVFGHEGTNDELARMLIGLSIISCDNDVNPLDGIQPVLERNISDIDQIGKLLANANSLFVVVNQVPSLTVTTSN